MAQIQSPLTFTPGQVLTAADLNAHVNSATLLAGSITDQTAVTAFDIQSTDTFNIYDASGAVLRKASVDDLMRSGMIATFNTISGKAGQNLTITPAGTYAVAIVGNLTSSGTLSVTSTSTLNGNVTAGGTLTVTGLATFNTNEAIKLPVGTTAQRPSIPVTGQIRFNSTNLLTEVYNGTIWEEVGGGPFDATGGNKIIAPDALATSPISATFSSANGESVVVTSAAHSVVPGQVVLIATAVTGYSGKWTVISANTNDFTFVMTTTAAPNSGACTYKKSGNFKCHIFTSSGTFTAGNKESPVEVLVVGGGGGGAGGGSANGGGGGGAVCYYPHYTVTSGQVITVTIGNGGAPASNGSASVFNTITAGGGLAGSGTSGGSSGNGFGLCPSNAGGTGQVAGGSNFPAQGGGGGGAGRVGNNGTAPNGGSFPEGGDGGDGKGSSITGISLTFGGGGAGGGRYQGVAIYSATASNGGGGHFVAVEANSGGGGSGAPYTLGAYPGGSGIVIVRYPYWV